MKIGLFIPCYIDQFYPQVGKATLELLEKMGCEVDYPMNQTCCGQPMGNSGSEKESIQTAELFVKNFQHYDYIVAPTGSCVCYVKEHYDILEQTNATKQVRENIYELSEFIIDILKIDKIDAVFRQKVGLHSSCHGQRGLRLAQSSEINAPFFSKQKQLLSMVQGLELIELDRPDECCGFGGTFCVTEEAVSVKMGIDKVADFIRNGAEVITAGDMSCLMHLEGIIKRQKYPVKVLHLAEILNNNL
jgi:L-lactate dehydrogenase complex protein LldE